MIAGGFRRPGPNRELAAISATVALAAPGLALLSARELLTFLVIPFREAAYGISDVRARVFDLLHVEAS
jgi:hypothetical protein